jgi:hypothetical protein
MTEGETTMSFSEEQTALAADVLDQLIPARERFPGAGELDVAQHVDSVGASDPGLGRLFNDGLAAIEAASHRAHSAAFADLADDQKVQVLRTVEAESPQFFAMLLRHTYAGYYSNPRIIELLGLEVRPPQPLGFDLEPFDPSTVEKVRERGKVWRDA